ncbi:MAG: Crp/Fnr family transcriptional regulator [Saprospiraceae bacterium]
MNKTNFSSIYGHPLIKPAEYEKIAAAHDQLVFKKGDTFLLNGETAREYYLITTGLVRSFVYDYTGNEITTDFFSDNDFAIEVSSFFQQVPTRENIVAVTDGTAWKMSLEKFQELFITLEGIREWGRQWMSLQLFLAKQRSVDIVTKSAKDRYLELLNTKPEIIQNAPLKQIASYLGVTDTSLSRIRRGI